MFHIPRTLFFELIPFSVKMDPEKWQNKAHVYIKQNVQSRISQKKYLNQVIIQRELESINFSATNGTFVTKGEIESNFFTTLNNKPKLNHWVKAILKQIVIQFEPSRRCI